MLRLKSKHRIKCGDSTSEADVADLMDGDKADMVFTDPPYGMNLDTDYSKMPNGINHDKIIGDDKYFKPPKFIFDMSDMIFLWGADYYCWDLPKNGSWVVWDKRSKSDSEVGILDGAFGSDFELCWTNDKRKRSICRVLRETGAFLKADEKKIHPTQKPVTLAEWFFGKWGKDKNLIVDLFLGSGSTLIACEKTDRRCYGMEIDVKYMNVILKRYSDYCGGSIVKA